MKNGKKIISFEKENEPTYYVVSSPDLRFGQNKNDAIIFDDHDKLMEALNNFKHISFPWRKMIINDA